MPNSTKAPRVPDRCAKGIPLTVMSTLSPPLLPTPDRCCVVSGTLQASDHFFSKCLDAGLLPFGRLICSALEVVGRHLKARGLRCIATFACFQCSPAETRGLDAKLISI